MFKFLTAKKIAETEVRRSPSAEFQGQTPLAPVETRPLTAGEIQLGFLLFLGRRPGDDVVENALRKGMDLERLRKTLGNTKEFFKVMKRSNPNLLSSEDVVRPKIENTIIHLHIPKTAGTSLNRALIENCRGWRFVLGTRSQCAAQLKAMPEKERAKIDVLTGHVSPDIAEFLPRPAIFVCMLRDAKPRIFSYFKHLKARPEHPWNKEVSRLGDDFGGFLDLVKTRGAMRAEFDNGQMRQLASDRTAEGFGRENELFESACSLIASEQSIVGFSREFKAFQSKLVAAGILTETVTVFENVSKVSGDFDEAIAGLKPEQAKLLAEYTIWDERLIAFATSIKGSSADKC